MSTFLTIIQLVLILGAGFLLTHKALPWAVVRAGRALGFPMKLSPIWAKRIARFKTIRRGYFAFRIVTTLFVVSFFLELMVNNRALFLSFDGRWGMPAFQEWLDHRIPFVKFHSFKKARDFGQIGESEVEYRKFQRWSRNPALLRMTISEMRAQTAAEEAAFLALPPPAPDTAPAARVEWERRSVKLEAERASIEALEKSYPVFASGRAFCLMPLYPFAPGEHLLDEIAEQPPSRPSWKHPLGTDDSGLDVLPQLLYGFRISFSFALIVTSLGYLIGVVIGAVMGYYGGWTDILVQRFIEIWASIPFLYLIMIIADIIKPNFLLLAGLMVVLSAWMGITYTIRGEFYREKARDYVQAAIAMGASDWKVMLRHILPNALVPIVTFAPFAVEGYIASLVSLDFLGFGLPVGTPSWGHLLGQGMVHIRNYPHLILAPIAAMIATLFSIVMVGEAVREAFDPKVFSRLR
jgi:microcin C transport system permease protein